jgi:rSAM/selenodomain-associated transferase 1
VPEAEVTLWVAGAADHPHVAELARPLGVAVREQQGADLGARMHHAFVATAAPLVLVGTDCPQLAPADLVEATTALAASEVVIQPATDGGYVLIGLDRPRPPLFDSMPWGTPEVLPRTLQRIAALGLRCTLRPPLDDLDTAADLDRAIARGLIAAGDAGGPR